jgi:hypothetical protein
VAAGERGDRGRVDAAGEERADGDVGAHVPGDRVGQRAGDPLVQPATGAGAAVQDGGEVALVLDLATRPDGQVRPGLDAADRAVQRRRLRDVLQQQVVLQRREVEVGRRAAEAHRGRQLEQALLLAAEEHAVRAGGHEERLDAERVARAEQHPLPAVPDQEREHAAQPADRGRPPVVVGGDDGLGVALGAEAGAVAGGELGAQLRVVVDLAVENDRVTSGRSVGRPGGVRIPVQRLVGAVDVDDGQPVEPEEHVGVGPRAALVRAAVAGAGQGAGQRPRHIHGPFGVGN